METKQEQLRHLEDIKKIMEKSSRFLSLSGLSGVFAGIYALLGALLAWYILDFGKIRYTERFHILNQAESSTIVYKLLAIGLIVLFLSLLSVWLFSKRKAKKNGYNFYNSSAKRVLFHLSIPLITGGFFCILLFLQNSSQLIASATLIFYGLSLINAGKYINKEVQLLGISELVLGILAGFFHHYGLLLWAIGFGIMHILYGTIMYRKYDR